ncbi:tyrosine-protein phosphatase [Listeria sp. PSOL-1]|uniref:tyrosine-protein phosphatase n=1 Tax=Listeria sp. PSOL-1 TaxID=1844999 RepID=UPI0013D24C6B|nr:tyrosine-protein phosphatase [Listeria sp. PSOL-1]
MLKVEAQKAAYHITWSKGEFPTGTEIFQSEAPELSNTSELIGTIQANQTEFSANYTNVKPLYFILKQNNGETTVVSERTIKMEGTFNFRDMGGYSSANGRRVKWGKLFRSGNLVNLTENDITEMKHLGIKWICDLRSDKEVQAEPTQEIAGVDDRHIAIGTATNDSKTTSLGNDKTIYEPLMGDSYRVFVDSTAEFKVIFDLLLQDGGVPFLFHCTAGKDRTGVLGALLLKVLDVNETDIFTDYQITNQYSDQILAEMDRLLQQFGASDEKINLENFRPMAEARPSYLEIAFDEMRKTYGSVERYIEEGIGITAEMKQKLQALLLE